jgi:hypothetical protein
VNNFLDEYVDVAERIRIAKAKYPELTLQSEWSITDTIDGVQWIVVKAWAYRDAQDTKPAIGHAWEVYPGKTPYTRGSELMVGETSAWGRALAALGIEVKKIASKQEVIAAGQRGLKTPDTEKAKPAKKTSVPAEETYATIQQRCQSLGITGILPVGMFIKYACKIPANAIHTSDDLKALVSKSRDEWETLAKEFLEKEGK